MLETLKPNETVKLYRGSLNSFRHTFITACCKKGNEVKGNEVIFIRKKYTNINRAFMIEKKLYDEEIRIYCDKLNDDDFIGEYKKFLLSFRTEFQCQKA